jgi:hypothetical protein
LEQTGSELHANFKIRLKQRKIKGEIPHKQQNTARKALSPIPFPEQKRIETSTLPQPSRCIAQPTNKLIPTGYTIRHTTKTKHTQLTYLYQRESTNTYKINSNKMTSANPSPTTVELDHELRSSWYTNKRAQMRPKKQMPSQHTKVTDPTTYEPPEHTITTLVSPQPPNTLLAQATPSQFHKRSTLTNFPFFSRNAATMTVLSKATTTAQPHPTPATILNMARSVSSTAMETRNNTTPISATPRDDWQKVPRRENTNNKYYIIPKIIPPAPETSPTPATEYRIPLVIRITAPNSQHKQFDRNRILAALLHAFQSVSPAANIQPTPRLDGSSPQIHNLIKISDIPSGTDEELNCYIEVPSEAPFGTFCARIILATNIELHHYKKDQYFVQWLKTEHIQLDRNPLQETIRPQQVGFFTHMITRTDQTTMYEHRAQLTLSDTCPPFFFQTSLLKIGNIATKVWKVYAASTHIPALASEIQKNIQYSPTSCILHMAGIQLITCKTENNYSTN